MKVSAHVIGGGFPRVDALVNDVRRRAIERLRARLAARREIARAVERRIRDVSASLPPETR